MSIFFPTVSVRRAYEITPQLLDELEVKALILDVDNTLTTHGNPEPDEKILVWLEQMKHDGIALMILSNNNGERVRPFARRLGLDFESSGAKPLPRGFRRCCERLGLARDQVAVVGDQIFTDVAGANWSGIKSILVDPIEPERGVLFGLKRLLERPFLRAYRKKCARKGENP